MATEVSPKLCECGCGQPTRINLKDEPTKGWIKGQPRRFIKGHSSRKTGPLYNVTVSGCWEWTGARDPNGYGRWSQRLAHRLIYERERREIPPGLQIDHLCRNPGCVNPDHLEPVTNVENSRRGRMTRLTAEQVRTIRSAVGITHAALGRRYGVTGAYVGQLRAGKWWPGV